ncbi:MAG TPA: rhomboid family intramembrane serine protease [Chthoniobacterales bacterium]|jgi:membrane associated rhomboid family serine protease
MFLILPYEVRTLTQRTPWANLLILLLCVLIFGGFIFGILPEEGIPHFVFEKDNPLGAVSSIFMHAGWGHLIGNMIFLWVSGNAICGVMRSTLYFALYVLMGIMAAGIHFLVDGRPCVGASGAISGLLGVFLALYPLNRIHSFYLIIVKGGTWDVPGWVLLTLWFGLQLFSAMGGPSKIAYWAHIGGFVSGIICGLVLIKLQMIDTGEYDNPNLLEIISGKS